MEGALVMRKDLTAGEDPQALGHFSHDIIRYIPEYLQHHVSLPAILSPPWACMCAPGPQVQRQLSQHHSPAALTSQSAHISRQVTSRSDGTRVFTEIRGHSLGHHLNHLGSASPKVLEEYDSESTGPTHHIILWILPGQGQASIEA